MDYSVWALLLLLVGVLLLVAEVFIPSGGLISIASASCLFAAAWCAWFAWWPSSPGYFWTFIVAMALMLPAALSAALYVWPSTSIGKRAILQEPLPSEVAPFVELGERYNAMIGKIGETVTMLNPAGIARIEGERVHCQSEGVILDAGTPVRVLAVQGNRIIVRKVTAGEQREATADTRHSQTPDDKGSPRDAGPLDFDIA